MSDTEDLEAHITCHDTHAEINEPNLKYWDNLLKDFFNMETETIEIETLGCPECGRSTVLTVNKQGYDRWKAGEYLQEALPELTDDYREMLISGTCPTCWMERMPDPSWSKEDYYDPYDYNTDRVPW